MVWSTLAFSRHDSPIVRTQRTHLSSSCAAESTLPPVPGRFMKPMLRLAWLALAALRDARRVDAEADTADDTATDASEDEAEVGVEELEEFEELEAVVREAVPEAAEPVAV